ncbi:hypothetical protein F5148DRAFT_1216362 [Russula earlei]|uniref:Uncharacterized protein n=1 Tax=Russula earlei TaxID=71964 RepID=A0ACC0U443_9AGAM|nr:hypothetical protein F5148DRAFT_1216362 [Russula earlei]
MSLDLAASPPTASVAQSPLWASRQPFESRSWSSAGTSSSGPAWSSLSDAIPSYSIRELPAFLRLKLDEKDRLLAAVRAELAAAAWRVVYCVVCMDSLPEKSMTRIEPCGHSFCRDCVRGLVVSQIESRRFPVLCPTCTAEPENNSEVIGKVTRELVLNIGITVEQYDIWIELEMSEFFVRLQCRKCQYSSFFNRRELNEARNLKCPSALCNHVWCKGCQQEIVPHGPEHSCDGSLELKHLVHQRGWKYCPTCRTPCEKISGCDSVTCISPGCNSRFCYRCGELTFRSGVPAIAARQPHRCRP